MFQNILGNNKIKESLQESVINDKVSHSYLFIGMSGIGKKINSERICKSNTLLRK